MRILFVLTYYRPHWTGLTQYAARLAEGLRKKNNQVSVLTSQHDKSLLLEEKIQGVEVFRVKYLFKFLRSVIMPSFPGMLWKKIKENEVVVVYLPLQEVLLAAFICKIQKKKLYLVHNGDLVLPEKCGFLCRLIEDMYFWMTSLAISLSNGIIIQTTDYAENSQLLSRFKEKWKLILPLFEARETTKEDISNFIIAKNLVGKKLIGFSGRFVEEKGIDFLLEAIPSVLKEEPTVHFVFAGDQKIQYEDFLDKISPLIEKYKEHITLLGLIKDQTDVFTFYHCLEVYVQPSRTDCFPSSQVEALLCGIPSVCTDIPGARWVVVETKMGEIVEPKNSLSLAEGIIKILKNRKKYLKGSDKVKKIFDYQKTLFDYEKLFRQD